MKYENKDELIAKARKLRDTGLSYRKIAEYLDGPNYNTIIMWLDDSRREKKLKKDIEYYYANKQRILAKAAIYRKENKDKIKERNSRYYQMNKAKIYDSHKKYKKLHREQDREYQLKYRETHKIEISDREHRRRDILSCGETILKEQYDAIWEEQNGMCFYCNKQMLREGSHSNPDYYNIEHINSINQGGLHVLSNIVYACAGCNWSKNDSLVEDWMPDILPKIAANPRLRYDIEEAHMRWLL